MKHITHPLIKPGVLEERAYQLSVAMRALEGNTMVVLPTGLGKTAVALLVAASRIRNTGGKMVMLAPTKPLVEQHYRFFSEFFIEPDDEKDGSGIVMFTGETKTAERSELFSAARLIFATPQVVKNDCLAGRYDLKDVSLFVVDECHRAVGNYSYVFLAGLYNRTAHHPLLLAMTASPGSNQEKLLEVCENLGVAHVESRTDEDADVRPYIHERDVKYVDVLLPDELQVAVDLLNQIISHRLEQLSLLSFSVPKPNRLSMKALNGLNAQIQMRIKKRDPSGYTAASIHAELMKIRHAITLAESQGSEVFKGYLFRLSAEGVSSAGTKASQRLAADPLFQTLLEHCDEWQGELHPKPDMCAKIVKNQLAEYPESRVIVFATYRDTVQLLVDHLKRYDIEARRFVGQASKDAEKGLSQKQQLETLQAFREGAFKVLIATSVGEEGLDVPSTDMVIFYEAVPSEIRSIQRKGRTGRHGSGTIVVLVTKGTSDETFRYVSHQREKSMKKGVAMLPSLSAGTDAARTADVNGQTHFSEDSFSSGGSLSSIAEFIPAGPFIVADDRETSSKVVEVLHTLGADLEVSRLETGDYQIGTRILVERKTTRDFMDTFVDRDIFGQLQALADAAVRPVLIIEGEDLYGQRNMHPNAVRGALSAIALDMGISIFFTGDADETAGMLWVMANREGSERGTFSPHRHKSYRSVTEQQEYIISAFPGVGPKHARLLLEACGSVEGVICADEETLLDIQGIGKVIAGAVIDMAKKGYKK